MNEKSFSISASLREGWELTKVNIGFLVVYQIILAAVAYLFKGPDWTIQNVILFLIGQIILMLGNMGYYNSLLILTIGGKPRFNEFYKHWRKLPTWIISNILFSLILFIGLVLLIVPGLWFMACFGLFPFFILDKNAGPIEAFKQSLLATKGIRVQVLLLFLAILGINILGLLFFIVGLLITIPVTLIALTTVYRRITGQSKTSIQPETLIGNF